MTRDDDAVRHARRFHDKRGDHALADAVNDIVGDTWRELAERLRAAGLTAPGDDRAFYLEAAMLDYVIGANPEAFPFMRDRVSENLRAWVTGR